MSAIANTTYNSISLGQPKTITKIVTFYSDGTFTESFPSPYPQWNPYSPHINPPWWQGPVSNSQMWGVPNVNVAANVTIGLPNEEC